MKNLWIIANWKSNKNIQEALAWLEIVGPKIAKKENVKVVVCPTFTDIEEVKKTILVGNYPILVGAQDLSPFEDGPHTGEESARILSDLVDLAILGHSERRQNFNETDEMVAEKSARAKEYHITPLVCVQNDKTPVPENVKLVAFEPVFAIGTGQADSPEDANQVAAELKGRYGNDLEILYGGSTTSANAKSFLEQSNLNGLLIGQSSLDGEEFVKIVEVAYRV
ncbi:triosephosphate isomerase [Candidatus Daviesbacteria bacterium]|nr:triosephosphate isomerase [Candidatus Daviesbacteria bacterium]